jgi:hypothetical protein
MQNMYVGDIGDYGKYGLLRALFSGCKLGVVWYLVPNENHLNDGRHIDYLVKEKYKECDLELFSLLSNIVISGKRNVAEIERSAVLPNQTKFYSEYLSYNDTKANCPAGKQKRILIRNRWLDKALETVKGCNVVFLDPDNGLQTPSVSKYSKKAPKYVFYDEIERFLSLTNTLMVYHHFSRNGNHIFQIRERQEVLQSLAGNSHKVVSLRFKPYSPRAYFIITSLNDIIDEIYKFANSYWKQCFELIE